MLVSRVQTSSKLLGRIGTHIVRCLSWCMLARIVDRHPQMQQLLVRSCKVLKELVLVLGV